MRYVSGMTDRYALGLGVELLGWRPEDLPRRVDHAIRCDRMGILDDDVARVREATDLVALVGEHVALKRVGRRFQGLCPFHPEKTPSFSVNPEKGVYYCFGCQKSGDAITFVREVEHLDFVGAIERLAARAGITLRYDDANFSRRSASGSSGCTKPRKPRSTSTISVCSVAQTPATRAAISAVAASTAMRPAGSRSAGRPTASTR